MDHCTTEASQIVGFAMRARHPRALSLPSEPLGDVHIQCHQKWRVCAEVPSSQQTTRNKTHGGGKWGKRRSEGPVAPAIGRGQDMQQNAARPHPHPPALTLGRPPSNPSSSPKGTPLAAPRDASPARVVWAGLYLPQKKKELVDVRFDPTNTHTRHYRWQPGTTRSKN